MVVLASEPLCLCGVDVAAPQQIANRETVIDLCSASVGIFSDTELVLLNSLDMTAKVSARVVCMSLDNWYI